MIVGKATNKKEIERDLLFGQNNVVEEIKEKWLTLVRLDWNETGFGIYWFFYFANFLKSEKEPTSKIVLSSMGN